MNFTRDIDERLSRLALPPTRRMEIVEELSQHLQDRYDELRAAGVPERRARREALLQLARLTQQLAEVEPTPPRDVPPLGARAATTIGGVVQDIRYALRTLRKSVGFTAVVVVTLALGIGATTAIFSVVDAVMLRPLPFPNADRLVRIWESDVLRGRPQFAASQPNFLDFREKNHSFERLAASSGVTLNLGSADGVEPVIARAVSIDFLPALGVSPAIGRNFLPGEDRPGGNTRVAIVTHGFWQRRLGGDSRALAATLTLDDRSYSVVGVLPKSFEWAAGVELFVPLAADPTQNRGDHRLTVIGLLNPGVSLEQATADMTTIARQLSDQYPESNKGWSVLLRSFYDWLVPQEARRALIVFVVAVAFVLLIAAGNVANLMLARSAARRKELAVRVALGAGRARIASQLLVESIVLAIAGGALACGVAVAATRVLQAIGPDTIPRLDEVTVDARVLLFAAAVSIVTGVLFGLAPALQASRPNTNESLNDAGRSGTDGVGGQRLRDALVVVEVALSVALLVAAGLLIRSLWSLQNVNPGFEPRNLLTLQVSVSGPAYQSDTTVREFYRRALGQISALPGVVAAGASSIVPLSGGNTSIEVVVPGRPADASGVLPSADWRIVSQGYFKTLGIRLRGRDFDDRDVETNVTAIVSEEMARRYWPGEDPIGRYFLWHSATGPRVTVVGVAADIRHLALETDPAPIVYLPLSSSTWNPMFVSVRTATDPAAYATSVRSAVRSVDAKVPISNVRTAEEILALSIGPRRFNMILLASFAGVALVLASVGLFGVMSYLVAQRTHDIGVRLALGALPRDVFRLVVGRGLLLASAGAAVGLVAALFLTRSLAALLFQVRPNDAATFGGVIAVLLSVAAAACYIPARRATRVDPVVALRYE